MGHVTAKNASFKASRVSALEADGKRNLSEWKTNLYGGVVVLLLLLVAVYAAFKDPADKMFGWRKNRKNRA